ncbi:hypothetical protein Cgig2_023339 [Carnegiea gigantea]|uniref:DUF4216 domain-containing protein n=1 Tax=Carnegiea gigantea TaxID=171969 RepID=A0A9Q1QBN1_9CARY|nr:hypothetical protein Cgig2_023339 [Carnegiea gigantea]
MEDETFNEGDERVTEELVCLARGPMKGSIQKKSQRKRKTQDSGVVVEGEIERGERTFTCDALKDRTSPRVMLFKCKWFDVYTEGRGVKRDKFSATLANVTRSRQVFYVAVHNEPQWRIVIKINPCNYFDFLNIKDVDNMDESLWENVDNEPQRRMVQEEVDEEIPLVRNDVEPDLIDVDLVDTTITQHTYFQDEEVDVSEDEEDEFSDRESDIDSLDRDLEDDDLENDSDNEYDCQELQAKSRRVKHSSCVGRKRGPTIGLQSLREREKYPNVKPFATITGDMLRVVGKNANRFIAEWNFPPEAKGIDVARAVELQCMMSFREINGIGSHWADPKQRVLYDQICFGGQRMISFNQYHISEKNQSNRLSQKIKPSNGAKSTARIYHDDIMPLYTLAKDSTQDPTKEQTTEISQDPPYAQLAHKDGKWDPEGEKHGVDNLSLKEAYVEVLKKKPGYHRGPGPGPVPPRKGRKGRESNQIRSKLGELKAASLELKTSTEHMQKEAIERENKWKQEAIERENNIREEHFDLIRLYIPQ